jgi:hypothetical protein
LVQIHNNISAKQGRGNTVVAEVVVLIPVFSTVFSVVAAAVVFLLNHLPKIKMRTLVLILKMFFMAQLNRSVYPMAIMYRLRFLSVLKQVKRFVYLERGSMEVIFFLKFR